MQPILQFSDKSSQGDQLPCPSGASLTGHGCRSRQRLRLFASGMATERRTMLDTRWTLCICMSNFQLIHSRRRLCMHIGAFLHYNPPTLRATANHQPGPRTTTFHDGFQEQGQSASCVSWPAWNGYMFCTMPGDLSHGLARDHLDSRPLPSHLSSLALTLLRHGSKQPLG